MNLNFGHFCHAHFLIHKHPHICPAHADAHTIGSAAVPICALIPPSGEIPETPETQKSPKLRFKTIRTKFSANFSS